MKITQGVKTKGVPRIAPSETDGGAGALPESVGVLRAVTGPHGTPAPAPPANEAPCSVLGSITRSTGLYGDTLTLAVDLAAWEVLQAALGDDVLYEVTAGDSAESITLGGYVLANATRTDWGRNIGEDESIDPHPTRVIVELMTLPGVWRDGRGGTLRMPSTINPVTASGIVDDEHEDYLGCLDLITACCEAIGYPVAVAAGGAELDAVTPPGPLDWGNARPLAELDGVLAHCGAGATLSNDGTHVRVYRLGRAGDDIDIPSGDLALAEPFEFSYAPGVRGRAIVVTSGEKRATVVTSRDLDGGLEWVWFDEQSGRWLNDAQTQDLYPGSISPNDIEAFNAGPPKEGTREKRAEFERLFRAVRLSAGDRPKLARLEALPEAVTIDLPGGGEATLSGGQVICLAKHATPREAGQWVNEPSVFGAPAVQVQGVRAHTEEGVFSFPLPMVRMGGLATVGAFADAVAIEGADLTLVFAHESATGRHLEDYFVRGYIADDDGEVTQMLTALQLEAAIASAFTVVTHAPFLARVMTRPQGLAASDAGAPVNDAELEAVALSIAKVHADADLAQTGTVPLRGLLAIEPGDWGGVVTSVTWDIAGHRTLVNVNEHAEPGGVMDELAAESNRSYAAGLSRFSLPGSHAAAAGVRAGASGEGALARGGVSPGARGAEATVPAAAKVSHASPAPVGLEAGAVGSGRILAKISGAESVGTNRWEYAWAEAALAASGALSVLDGGRTSETHGAAFNLAEGANDGVGVEGNGIDRASLPAGWTMQPIAERFVELVGPFGAPDAPHYLFSATNLDDGECPGEEADSDGGAGAPGAVRTADEVLMLHAMLAGGVC